MEDERITYYQNLLKDADQSEFRLVNRLVEEVVFCEKQMEELKKLPFIAVNPKNLQQQKVTSAARLYKDYASAYRDAIRILLNILRKVESSAQDELLRKLEEFV